jgi:hypothetical protein
LDRRLPKTAIVYQCPVCDARLLGHQRCEECGVFGRRLGPGGRCPHCDEVIAIADLLAELRSSTLAAGGDAPNLTAIDNDIASHGIAATTSFAFTEITVRFAPNRPYFFSRSSCTNSR